MVVQYGTQVRRVSVDYYTMIRPGEYVVERDTRSGSGDLTRDQGRKKVSESDTRSEVRKRKGL